MWPPPMWPPPTSITQSHNVRNLKPNFPLIGAKKPMLEDYSDSFINAKQSLANTNRNSLNRSLEGGTGVTGLTWKSDTIPLHQIHPARSSNWFYNPSSIKGTSFKAPPQLNVVPAKQEKDEKDCKKEFTQTMQNGINSQVKNNLEMQLNRLYQNRKAQAPSAPLRLRPQVRSAKTNRVKLPVETSKSKKPTSQSDVGLPPTRKFNLNYRKRTPVPPRTPRKPSLEKMLPRRKSETNIIVRVPKPQIEIKKREPPVIHQVPTAPEESKPKTPPPTPPPLPKDQSPSPTPTLAKPRTLEDVCVSPIPTPRIIPPRRPPAPVMRDFDDRDNGCFTVLHVWEPKELDDWDDPTDMDVGIM